MHSIKASPVLIACKTAELFAFFLRAQLNVRHNEIRDITANLLTEVCHDVQVEPDLQEVTSEVLWIN